MKMQKGIMTLLIGASLISGVGGQAAKVKDISVYNKDSLIIFDDVNPYIDENGRTMVPIRTLAENLGYAVIWNGDSGTTTIYDKKSKAWIEIKNDSEKYTTPRGTFSMDTKVKIEKDRTFVPIRFVTEGLGSDVKWKEVNDFGLIFIFNKDISNPVRERIISDTLKRPYYNNFDKIEKSNIDDFTFTEEIDILTSDKPKDKKEEYQRDLQERVNYLRDNIKEGDDILKVLKSAKQDKNLDLTIRVFGGSKYIEDEKYSYYIEGTYKDNGKTYKYKYKLF